MVDEHKRKNIIYIFGGQYGIEMVFLVHDKQGWNNNKERNNNNINNNNIEENKFFTFLNKIINLFIIQLTTDMYNIMFTYFVILIFL